MYVFQHCFCMCLVNTVYCIFLFNISTTSYIKFPAFDSCLKLAPASIYILSHTPSGLTNASYCSCWGSSRWSWVVLSCSQYPDSLCLITTRERKESPGTRTPLLENLTQSARTSGASTSQLFISPSLWLDFWLRRWAAPLITCTS